jgi:DNA primase
MVRGEDGTQRFQAAIDAARPASAVLMEALTDGLSLDSPDGRATLIEKARPYVNALPPEAFRAELIGELAQLARLPADDLRTMYARTPSTSSAAVDKGSTQQKTRVTPVSRALSLLFADSALAERVRDSAALREADTPGATILAEAIEFFAQTPNVSVSQWLERYREHRFFDRLQELAATTPPGDAESRAQEFDETVARLGSNTASLASLRRRYDELVAQQNRGPLDAAAATELQQIHQQLRRYRQQTG